MALKNCERCGRLFSGVDPLCPSCLGKDREEFDLVRAYLEEHPGAPVAEVSGATGVSVPRIHAWVRQGRLKMTVNMLEGALSCERCGAPIESGRFCSRCLDELARGLKKAAEAAEAAAPPAEEAGEPASGAPRRLSSSTVDPRRPRVHIIHHILRRRGQ